MWSVLISVGHFVLRLILSSSSSSHSSHCGRDQMIFFKPRVYNLALKSADWSRECIESSRPHPGVYLGWKLDIYTWKKPQTLYPRSVFQSCSAKAIIYVFFPLTLVALYLSKGGVAVTSCRLQALCSGSSPGLGTCRASSAPSSLGACLLLAAVA